MKWVGALAYYLARVIGLLIACAVMGAVIGAIVGLFTAHLLSATVTGAGIGLEIGGVFFVWGVVIAIRNALRGDYRRSYR